MAPTEPLPDQSAAVERCGWCRRPTSNYGPRGYCCFTCKGEDDRHRAVSDQNSGSLLGDRDAVLSDCGTYRYQLSRTWDDSKPPAMFIGLNPSTADATEDDPTIRRCVRFARDWGYGGLLMANLFAYRATDPKRLAAAITVPFNPVGERDGEENVNDRWLRRMGGEAGIIIAAWGATPMPKGWEYRAARVHRDMGILHALGVTKDGHPRHPLYVRATAQPFPLPNHEHDWGPWRMSHQSLEVRYCKTCGAEQWD